MPIPALLIDGDKTSNTSGSNYTLSLTDAEGNPTSIDGFRMYLHRGDRTEMTANANIMIQETVGGDFVSIGSFSTGWVKNAQNEICLVEFEQTYVAYAIQLNFDSNLANHEFELFQYQKIENPNPPAGGGTEPTNPTEGTEPAPTQNTQPAPTQGTEPAPTQSTQPAPTQGTEPAPTQGTEPAPTEGTEPAPTEGTEPAPTEPAPTEPAPTEPAPVLPELPELPATPDTEKLFATIEIISALNPQEYTAESYAALVEAAETVNAMIDAAGGVYTQEMLDEFDAILSAAVAGLVKIDGEGDTNNGGAGPDNDPNNGGTGPDDEYDPNPDTGDVAITVLGTMMTLSAMGGAVVIGKKKFF